MVGKEAGSHVMGEDAFLEVLLPVESELAWPSISYGLRLSSLSVRAPGDASLVSRCGYQS